MKLRMIAPRSATLLLCLGGFAAVMPTDAVFARPVSASASYVLHGTGMFGTSVGSATVTRLASGRYRLALNADHLPSPSMLHVKFARHAYVAWLVNGKIMHGPMRMASLALVATGHVGHYTAQGTVAIGGVTSVVVTAEPSAQARMPIMPVLTVLTSGGHQM